MILKFIFILHALPGTINEKYQPPLQERKRRNPVHSTSILKAD